MKQPEATFKKALNEAFAAVFPLGWCSYVKALAKDGVPDLHYQTGQGALWVEAKVGRNPLRKSQVREIHRMVIAGARVVVVRLIRLEGAQVVSMERRTSGSSALAEPLPENLSARCWNDRATWDFWRAIFFA